MNDISQSNTSNFSQTQNYISPNIPESSNVENITMRVYEVPISSNNIKIVFECEIYTTEVLSYYYYNNQSLIHFGIISPIHQILVLNQTVTENGDYVLTLELYNSSLNPFYITSFIYHVSSIDDNSNLQSLSTSWRNILIIIGIGSVIVIPSYIIAQKLMQRKRDHELSNVLSGIDSYRQNHIPLQSIMGNSNTNFARLMGSPNIKSEDKISFLLSCASIVELRLYSYQSLKLEYRITPKRYLLNSIKSKTLDDYRNSILTSSQDFESPFVFNDKNIQYQYIKITAINYCVILLLESNQDLSNLFKQTIHDLLSKFERDARTYLRDIKKLNELFVDFINLPIAYPIEVLDSLNEMQKEKQKIFHEIINTEKISPHIKSEITTDLNAMDLIQILRNKQMMQNIKETYDFDINFSDPEFQ